MIFNKNAHVTLAISMTLVTFSCNDVSPLEEVQIHTNGEEVHILRYNDTIASFHNITSSKSVNEKLFDLVPDRTLSNIENKWSCSLFLSENLSPIFDFHEMEDAINFLFKKEDLRKGDEDIANKFMLEKFFPGFYELAISNQIEGWRECESSYKRQLELALKTRTDVNSNLFMRGLDSCQIVQTLTANNIATIENESYTFLSRLECPSHDSTAHFLVNKPYYAISYSGEKPLKVNIELLNDLSYFGWISF